MIKRLVPVIAAVLMSPAFAMAAGDAAPNTRNSFDSVWTDTPWAGETSEAPATTPPQPAAKTTTCGCGGGAEMHGNMPGHADHAGMHHG
jgi:hypothetical protein